ncbi:MAG: GNAT family N-acetyltransferase [Archaeoglobi archaeon]|nr:GNAT family N-acetyltransferase [Candidatus Mnemosynella bozhongmuii]
MLKGRIRRCAEEDFESILEIINDAARAYRGVIPADLYREPHMSEEELQREINAGVRFWGYEEERELVGVMGLQNVEDVALIRHAYVRRAKQRQGIGTKLLNHLLRLTNRPVLVGTWADASWAISFYEKQGFRMVPLHEKDELLKRYWSISERQIETSVVLADTKWFIARSGKSSK